LLTLTVDAHDPDPALIAKAADVLRSGGIVAYPTDTLYGLAVDSSRDDAVDRLYAAKDRDAGLAVPLIAGSLKQASEAGIMDAVSLRLANAFWPGPLSLVVRAAPHLSTRLLGQGGTIAIRVPAHPVARALSEAFGACITATSANLSGQPAAFTAAQTVDAIGDRIDAIIDAGSAPGGPPSTIVQVAADGPRLIRAGAIAWDRVLESLQ
jgi:L-threonylcarbamoyladenylate synthase